MRDGFSFFPQELGQEEVAKAVFMVGAVMTGCSNSTYHAIVTPCVKGPVQWRVLQQICATQFCCLCRAANIWAVIVFATALQGQGKAAHSAPAGLSSELTQKPRTDFWLNQTSGGFFSC